MKTPLTILTMCFSLSFFDGVFSWGLPEGFYVLIGLTMMICIGYMWYVQAKS